MQRSPATLVQNLEPNTATFNEFSLRKILEDIIQPRRMTFPVHKKPGSNDHAYLCFDTTKEACEAAEMLDGRRLGNSILRAVALVEGEVKKPNPPPSENATESLAEANWPCLTSPSPSTDEFDDAASTSTWMSKASTIDAKPVKQWCDCCKRNTHTTQECRVLQYQWKQRGITCGYCKNINDMVVPIHHPITHKGITVCPMILKKQGKGHP